MAEDIRYALLQPSLTRGSAGRRMFSGEAAFVVALLSGAIGLTLFSLMNSYRVRRLKRDLRWYGVAISITAALCVAFVAKMRGTGADEADRYTLGYIVVSTHICGMFLWAAYYVLHRSAHRITRLSGGEYGRAFLPGLLCIVGAYGILAALGTLLRHTAGVAW